MRPPSAGDRFSIRLIGIGLVACVACDGKREDVKVDAAVEAAALASAMPVASAHPVSGTGTGTGTSGDAGLPICKVMASEGGPSARADASTWLELPGKANFTVRTLETGRELRFEGPGKVRPCGDDVALVAEGSAVGLPGSGEAPGAEQWVATACGVVRWASGVHRFTGGKDGCRMQASMGSAHLYLPEDVSEKEVAVDGGAPVDGGAAIAGGKTVWQRIDARRAFVLQSKAPLDGAVAVKTALGACERAAKDVQRIATSMTGGDAGSLGALAAESVAARGTARAACAVAAVRVALAGGKGPEQARLDAAVASWRAPR